MKNNTKSKDSGAFSATILVLVSFACVALIGLAGFLKFRIDADGTTLTEARMWSLGLTMLSWGSLIIAAATTAGLYVSTRNKQAAPIKALAQSVENLSRGDMHTPIWGMERSDAIGELARAIDLARYHFSELPDLSLMSEQGPVRIKFEGETRSLFSAMMNNITEDYEKTRVGASQFTAALANQERLLTDLSTRISKVLFDLHQHGQENERTLQNLTDTLARSANSMVNTQERSAQQLSGLIPFMQERAQNMAEVTHIAGTKVTKTLQAIVDAERNLTESATHGQHVLQQLTNTTNQMGERLFAAVNLMQASGKLLGETTNTAQSGIADAIAALERGETHLQGIITRAETRLDNTIKTEKDMASLASRTENSAERMEAAVRAMGERHESLSEQVVMATHRMEAIVNSFDGAQRTMSEAIQQIKRDGGTLNEFLNELRENNDRLLDGMNAAGQSGHGAVQNLTERGQALLQRLELQIAHQAQETDAKIEEIARHGYELSKQAQAATATLAQSVASLRSEQSNLSEIGAKIESKASAAFDKAERMAEASATKLASLTDNIENAAQRLNMLGQLTGTLGSVAGQLGQIVPALTKGQTGSASAATSFDSEALVNEIQTRLQKAIVQIEAMHDGLAQIVVQQKDQLETRLMVMDKKLAKVPSADASESQQTAIMNDIVNALSKINEHVMQLDEAIMEKEAREA